jgi:hypothetical protein
MARFGAQWDDWEQGKAHKARAIKKMQRIQGLKDLLDTHEADPDNDHEYVLKLRARLRAAQNQLESMAI